MKKLSIVLTIAFSFAAVSCGNNASESGVKIFGGVDETEIVIVDGEFTSVTDDIEDSEEVVETPTIE